jgi:predicted nucleic acid-binding protein
MLDTNVFNDFCDGNVLLDCLRGRRLLVTGIQEAELWNCEDEARRNALRDTFEKVSPDWEPAAQIAFDMAGAGSDQGSWGVNDHTHEAMLIRLRELEGVKAGSNQVADVLIAETAMRRNAVLVSGDKKLRTLASEFGVEVLSLEEFARR